MLAHGKTIAYTHSSVDRSSHFRHAVRTVPATAGNSQLLLREALSAVWSPDGRRVRAVNRRRSSLIV